MPDIPIALFTDEQAQAEVGLFDLVLGIDAPHRRSKVDCLVRSPFKRTLYLDADIRLRCDVGELFDLLDVFDIAMAHAHARNRPATRAVWRRPLPDAFPQFNTGVILVRRTAGTEALLHEWALAYRAAGLAKDQVTLRELLWTSGLRIATLPPEYNLRYPKYLWLWSRHEARPRICHFRRYGFPRPWDRLRLELATWGSRLLRLARGGVRLG